MSNISQNGGRAMIDNTQELDEILGHWIKGYINGSAGGFYVTNQTKQDILDWHNKQVEEVLDRLEGRARGAFDYEADIEEYAEDVLTSIEAERNKLKEAK